MNELAASNLCVQQSAGTQQRPPQRVAYLINHYPKVSHSFIRREILALERQGLPILRIAVRGWGDVLVDPADQAERERTRYVLQEGFGGPLRSALRLAALRPLRWFGAARLAVSMWRRSERTLFHHLAYLVEACQIVRWLEAEGIGHLHAHFGTNPAEVAMLVNALGGPPFSFTVHGPEEFDKPEALGLGQKGRRAAFVVAISSYGRSQLYRWLSQADWPKVKVVHCGLDATFHRVAAAGPAAAARLVCVGRLCEQKGQLLLLQAVHRVVANGHELQLVLAGDGEMRAEIEALIDHLKLRARVRITGWIGSEQVRDEILAARALILPSFAEGLPVVIMEAMALRRAVITTYVAGIPELVRDGENGWLVPAGDVGSLAQAIEACLVAPAAELARMGEAAHARVLERHDIDREAAKLAAHFAATPMAPLAATCSTESA
jgi:colanic acid/amylovoran biosynthesis glycosyltransferase